MVRKRDKSDQTLAAILGVAMDLAAQNGIQQLALGDIAKRLGISKSGVFVRVGSLQALQLLVVDECERVFRQAVLLPTRDEPPGLPRLDAVVSLWITHGGSMKALLGAHYKIRGDADQSALAERLQGGMTNWRQWLASLVDDALELGQVRSDTQPAQLVFEIVGIVLALLYDTRQQQDPQAVQRALAAYFRLMTTYRSVAGQPVMPRQNEVSLSAG